MNTSRPRRVRFANSARIEESARRAKTSLATGKAAEPKVLKEPFSGVTTDLLATQQRLFLAVEIGKPRPSDFSHFSRWVELHQFLVELLGMGDIPLVFFEGSRFKHLARLLLRTAEQQEAESTEYQSCGYHRHPFQASLRCDTFVFA